ncbi:hypothetical protein BDF19DRAFT_424549 [Syncephalis fuscata]|nr:hypothetical protein BDF19DRAFT_424549 [Syncephalis fuscata]
MVKNGSTRKHPRSDDDLAEHENGYGDHSTTSEVAVSVPAILLEEANGNTCELPAPTHPDFHINPPPVGRPIRIYCDGIYDLFHFGHAKALEQAKKAFPSVYLLVGVCNDQLTHSKKGRTVLTDEERYESLRHSFLDEHQIDYVAHDDLPYQSGDQEDVYAFVKKLGKFLPTQRTEGVSTSDLITRIVRDYDAYLRRNLQRGMTAKELNISFLKEQELNVKRSVDEMRESIRRNWLGTREELLSEIDLLKNGVKHTLRVWDERSTEFVKGFINKFGTDGVMQKILRLRMTPSQSPVDTDEDDLSDPPSNKKRRTESAPVSPRDMKMRQPRKHATLTTNTE